MHKLIFVMIVAACYIAALTIVWCKIEDLDKRLYKMEKEKHNDGWSCK